MTQIQISFDGKTVTCYCHGMNLAKEIIELFRLSKKETRVLKSLTEGQSYTVADIVRAAKLPRMTIYPLLDVLKKRKMIDFSRRGKRRYWFLVPADEFIKTISHSGSEIGAYKKIALSTHEDTGFTVFKGKETLLNLWKEFAEQHAGERIRAIQPTRSLLSAIKNYSPGEFVPINNSIKENKIVFETLVREDTFPSYMSFYKNNIRVQREILESFIGRSADAVFASNNYLNNNSDLLIVRDSALLMNWEKHVAIQIKNKEMVSLLLELFELARGYGKKVNQNEYLQEMLKRIQ